LSQKPVRDNYARRRIVILQGHESSRSATCSLLSTLRRLETLVRFSNEENVQIFLLDFDVSCLIIVEVLPNFIFYVSLPHQSMYVHQGQPLTTSVVRKTKEATVLAWHPVRKVLAVGWQTGEVTLRNEQDDEAYDVPRVHKTEITVMHWSSNGSRLLSADSVIVFVTELLLTYLGVGRCMSNLGFQVAN